LQLDPRVFLAVTPLGTQGEFVLKAVADLSCGERARLALAELVVSYRRLAGRT
jgi:ATPase subunit of ABC transporter with duplicated ATPase domains